VFGLLKLLSTDPSVSMTCLGGSEFGSIKRNLSTNCSHNKGAGYSKVHGRYLCDSFHDN
jgi:hypothetical protein